MLDVRNPLWKLYKKRLTYLRDYFSASVVLLSQKHQYCVLDKLLIFCVFMKIFSFAFVFAIKKSVLFNQKCKSIKQVPNALIESNLMENESLNACFLNTDIISWKMVISISLTGFTKYFIYVIISMWLSFFFSSIFKNLFS